jgi:uncharacterized protein with PIN domain
VKFYLDENLSPRVAETLRARGVDAVSAYEVGNAQLDDRAQLRYAAQEGRAIVTCDLVDFTTLAIESIAENREHAGIILVPSAFRTNEFAGIAQAIEEILRRYPRGLAGGVVYLTRSSR